MKVKERRRVRRVLMMGKEYRRAGAQTCKALIRVRRVDV